MQKVGTDDVEFLGEGEVVCDDYLRFLQVDRKLVLSRVKARSKTYQIADMIIQLLQ